MCIYFLLLTTLSNVIQPPHVILSEAKNPYSAQRATDSSLRFASLLSPLPLFWTKLRQNDMESGSLKLDTVLPCNLLPDIIVVRERQSEKRKKAGQRLEVGRDEKKSSKSLTYEEQ
jgi:hypothetical protein